MVQYVNVIYFILKTESVIHLEHNSGLSINYWIY
jgi:hypothetical protein